MNRDCEKCEFFDISHLDDPCFKCLSWHSSYRPCFVKKDKAAKKKKVKEKKPLIFKDENTPLPWN